MSASLNQLSDDDLRAKADECLAKANAASAYQVKTASGVELPPFRDEERTRLLLEAQSYLTEVDRRENAKTSRRDFGLELAVIVLIAVEIGTDLWGLRREGIEFDRQQAVLTSLEKSSEATAETLVALRKTMETMNATTQNQLALNYEVSAGLAFNRNSWSVSVTNKGRTSLTLWGHKIRNERHMLTAPVTITPGETRDVDFASFFEKNADKLPRDGQPTIIPLSIYLRSEDGNDYVAECPLSAKWLSGGSLEVRFQSNPVIGVSHWSHGLPSGGVLREP